MWNVWSLLNLSFVLFSAGEPSTKIAQNSFTKDDQMDSKFADLSVLAIKVSTQKS